MSTLRKIGQWLWLNKERILLFAMVMILVVRVYMVVYHTNTGSNLLITPPSSDPARLSQAKRPGVPPSMPAVPPPVDWSSLWVRNPFTTLSANVESSGGTNEGKALNIALLDIQVNNGKPIAKLHYGNATEWHRVGDAFTSFKLTNINPDDRTCEVYSEKEGKYVTLKSKK